VVLLAWGVVLGAAASAVWLWVVGVRVGEVAGVAARPVACSPMAHDPAKAFEDGARALTAALVRDGHTVDSAAQWFRSLITPHRVRQWLERGDPVDAPAAPTLPPPPTARAFQPPGEPDRNGPLLTPDGEPPEAEPAAVAQPVGD
jgi:hypothetical protein